MRYNVDVGKKIYGGVNMKIEIKRKEIKDSEAIKYALGYTELSHLFKESIFCVTSQYGWDCDLWFFPDHNIIISKGYRPIGSKLPIEIEEKFKNGGDINDFIKVIKEHYNKGRISKE